MRAIALSGWDRWKADLLRIDQPITCPKCDGLEIYESECGECGGEVSKDCDLCRRGKIIPARDLEPLTNASFGSIYPAYKFMDYLTEDARALTDNGFLPTCPDERFELRVSSDLETKKFIIKCDYFPARGRSLWTQ